MEFQLQFVLGFTNSDIFHVGLFIELATDLPGLPALWILGVVLFIS